ncbi:MAG TPA: HK97-gp10 family putative phage morphogenesis protein, partial [Wenzhouxiangella sp.]|nr:HK97-gp10 family putative phage morphogenesis protein [Wenzhouxiangella sp.]
MAINQGFGKQRKQFGIEVQGLEEVQKNLASLSKEYTRAVASAAVAGAELVRGEAIKSIQSVSAGERVTRYRNKDGKGNGAYEHVASAPNDAPNTDTGRLVSSILVDVKPFGIFVGSTLRYAGHLEFGTSNMEPRPWLNPALESQRRTIERLMIDA